MAFYLTHLLQNFYSDLGQTDPEMGLFFATGGSATTFVNSDWNLLESQPETDVFKGMYLFVVKDATVATGESALEGKYTKISGYVDTTWTGTMATMTQLIASGDQLMIAKQDKFPLAQVVFCANRALQNLGDIATVDESLTGSTTSTEYEIPVALKRRPPLAVYYQDSDEEWRQVVEWKYIPGAPGSVAKLYIPELPNAGTIRLVYHGAHPVLSTYSSVVSETIHPDVATAATVLECLKWYNAQDSNQGASEYMTWLEGQYKNVNLPIALSKNPIWRPQKQPRTWWRVP